MYPNRHSSVPSLPNVVLATAAGQNLAGVPAANGQGYFHVSAANQHSFALQASNPPPVHLQRMSLTSQCYPATYLATRQHYPGNLIYGHPSAPNNHQTPGMPYLKKRTVFPKHVTNKLRQWLKDNIENPFPDEEQKDQLCKDTKLTLIQLNYWFINARRRVWPGLRDEVNRERAKNNLPPIELPLNRRGKESEQFDPEEADGDLVITDDGEEEMADDAADGCVMLQTATSAQLKNVRKGSMSSGSDLSSGPTMTSSEDMPSAVHYAMGYSAQDSRYMQQSQSSDSTSGEDPICSTANSSCDNLSIDRGDVTLCRPSSTAGSRQPQQFLTTHQYLGKREPRLLLQAHRRSQLDANRLAPGLMQSAPCIYKPSGSGKEGSDTPSKRHHYQSMPQMHPSLVAMGSHRPPSSIYLPPPNLGTPAGSHESSATSSPAGSQYFTMVPSPTSVTNQVQQLHLGPTSFVQTPGTPPQQQPHQPIVFLMPSSQRPRSSHT